MNQQLKTNRKYVKKKRQRPSLFCKTSSTRFLTRLLCLHNIIQIDVNKNNLSNLQTFYKTTTFSTIILLTGPSPATDSIKTLKSSAWGAWHALGVESANGSISSRLVSSSRPRWRPPSSSAKAAAVPPARIERIPMKRRTEIVQITH